MIAARLLRRVFAPVLILIGTAAPTFAQDEQFKAGMQARDKKQWDDVIVRMQSAMAQSQDSDRKVKDGVVQIVTGGTLYVPSFFLGEAYFKKSDCVNALAAWARSVQWRAIEKDKDLYKTLKDGQAECLKRGVLMPDDYLAQYAAADKKYRDAAAVGERVFGAAKDLFPEHEDWRQSYQTAQKDLQGAFSHLESAAKTHLRSELIDAATTTDSAAGRLNALDKLVKSENDTIQTMATQAQDVERLIAASEGVDQQLNAAGARLAGGAARARQDARDLIKDARDKLAAGRRTRNLATIAEARAAAQLADSKFADVSATVRDQLREEQAKQFERDTATASEFLLSLETLLGRLDARAAQQPRLVTAEAAGERERVRSSLARTRRRFEDARTRQDAAGVQQSMRAAAQARAQLESMFTAFGPLTLEDRGVPVNLQEIMRAYLDGDYQKALTAVDAAPAGSFGALAVHAHVVRAASLYTLFIRSGEKDTALLTRATEAVNTARSVQPGFQPDPRVFSKRFLDFYNRRH
jgi:hypothetical protein